MKRGVIAVLAGVALTACAAQIRETEQMLSAAGFQMKAADTDERRAQLSRLPEHKLVVEHREGRPFFVFADPKECNCLFVGDERAYQEYHRLRLQKQIADEHLMATENLVNWRMWGPWPPWF